MKNILFPTDLSDNSWNALVYLLKFHVQKACTFYLMNAATAHSNHSSSNAEEEFLKLKKFAEDADANANHSFYLLNSSKQFVDAVSYAVKKYEIDMVALAADCAGPIKKSFKNPVLEIINKIRGCPVFLIPEAYDFTDLNTIAFIADLDRPYLEMDLNQLKKLTTSSKINMIYFALSKELSEMQKYNKKLLEKCLSEYECEFHMLPDSTEKISDINSFIEAFGIQILVAINAEFQWSQGVFEKQLIYEIGHCPKVPFLIIED